MVLSCYKGDERLSHAVSSRIEYLFFSVWETANWFFFLMIGWCRSGDGEGGGGLEMHVKTVGDSACVKLFFHCVELPHLSYQIIVGESA